MKTMCPDMKFTITGIMSQVLNVQLAPGDILKTAPGRLISKSFNVNVKINDSAFISSLKKMFSDSFIDMVEYSSEKGTGLVTVGPSVPGMIMDVDLGKGDWIMQKHGMLACSRGTAISREMQRHLGDPQFDQEGLVLLKVSGDGTAFISSCGDFTTMDLRPDDRYTVSTSHALAWESSVKYSIRSIRSKAEDTRDDDECVTDFKGPGRIVIQNMSEGDIAGMVARFSAKNQ